MTYLNFNLNGAAARGGGSSSRTGRLHVPRGVMPKRIFFKLLFSALAAVLAIHFWRQGGR
ncbi:MAG: hypothetical protein CTY15_14795 [Methylocystis sp.]|nr:MAG: hypothetical protein CTY15_14795 [Methylocystis sp.]